MIAKTLPTSVVTEVARILRNVYRGCL